MPEQDPTTALGFANAMKDLSDYTTEGGMLYVFALPAADSATAGGSDAVGRDTAR